MEYLKLNNGLSIPIVGFGVYKIEDPNECVQAVLDAIEVGYRLIDTAQLYVNEEAVGIAIKQSGINRNELFVTSKIWPSYSGYDKAKQSIVESLEKLQLDYLDCMMIHQPFGDYYGTYRALEEAYEKGLIKSIGVSNFYPDRLIDLIHYNKVIPVINQVEAHVFHQQQELRDVMSEYNMVLQAWSPLARGQNNLFNHELLTSIGEKYNKSAAQIALKYLTQIGISIIPKSIHKERIKENIDLFDFNLSNEELSSIKSLDKTYRITDHREIEVVNGIINRQF